VKAPKSSGWIATRAEQRGRAVSQRKKKLALQARHLVGRRNGGVILGRWVWGQCACPESDRGASITIKRFAVTSLVVLLSGSSLSGFMQTAPQ
jgi:hypothetical protein